MKTVIKVNGNKVLSFEGKMSLTLGEDIEILGIKQKVADIEITNNVITIECKEPIQEYKIVNLPRNGESLIKQGIIGGKNPFDYYR